MLEEEEKLITKQKRKTVNPIVNVVIVNDEIF